MSPERPAPGAPERPCQVTCSFRNCLNLRVQVLPPPPFSPFQAPFFTSRLPGKRARAAAPAHLSASLNTASQVSPAMSLARASMQVWRSEAVNGNSAAPRNSAKRVHRGVGRIERFWSLVAPAPFWKTRDLPDPGGLALQHPVGGLLVEKAF